MEQLRDWQGGEPVSASKLNEPIAALRHLLPLMGGGGINVTGSGAGTTMRVAGREYRVEQWIGIITNQGPATGADANGNQTYSTDYTDERYWVKRAAPSVDNNATEDSLVPFVADVPEKDDDGTYVTPYPVTAVNIAEMVAVASETGHPTFPATHLIRPGEIVRAYSVSDTQDPAVKHYYIDERPRYPVMTPVRVQQTGGSNGGSNAAATYTYSLYSYDSTRLLATAAAQIRPRPSGAVTVQSGSNGVGMAYPTGGTNWALWDAGEKPGTANCS